MGAPLLGCSPSTPVLQVFVPCGDITPTQPEVPSPIAQLTSTMRFSYFVNGLCSLY